MNPVSFLFRRMWQFSKGNRHKVVLYIILLVFGFGIYQILPLAVGFILNYIQDNLSQGISDTGLLWKLIAMLSVLLFIPLSTWIFRWPGRVMEMDNAFLVRANYKQYLLKGTMSLPIKWHTDNHSGDTFDKIEKGTTALFAFSQNTFWLIEGFIMLLISYITLTIFNIHSLYIVLFLFVFTIIYVLNEDKKIIEMIKSLNHDENAISAKVFDAVSNITTVIILRVEKLVQKDIWKTIIFPYTKNRHYLKVNETKWTVISAMTYLMTFLVLASYVITIYFDNSAIKVGNLFILYGYVTNISNLFFRFAWQYGETMKHSASVMNAEEISNEFEKINQTKAKAIPMTDWNQLLIDKLNFHYHDSNTDLHLNNVSLTLNKGEKIALIGESGSGKTTLLKIMRELYSPKAGSVYLDGVKLSHGFKCISENISLIPQDPEIFATTIEDNITMGIPHTKAFVKKFTDDACFTKVLPLLPNGIKSDINEKGVNLSGGQKQRLALARGLIASTDKEIILFDEATSSVDPKNEKQIYENILKRFQEKTIIATLHRLHLLPLFDTIYMLEGGKIIASGTFKELKSHSKFKKMWEKSKAED